MKIIIQNKIDVAFLLGQGRTGPVMINKYHNSLSRLCAYDVTVE